MVVAQEFVGAAMMNALLPAYQQAAEHSGVPVGRVAMMKTHVTEK